MLNALEKIKPALSIAAAMMVAASILTGCSPTASDLSNHISQREIEKAFADSVEDVKFSVNYKILVNKYTRIPTEWESQTEMVETKNVFGEGIKVESETYNAYRILKDDLACEGIDIGIAAAYRSDEAQQRAFSNLRDEYDEDFAVLYEATPGFSEHHTGLAIDLALIVDGKTVTDPKQLLEYPEIWAKVHASLAEHGFILRYPENQQDVTGYAYEPWHIRYVGSPDRAARIMDRNTTLEEYLGVADEARLANAQLQEAREAEKAERAAAEEAAAQAAETDAYYDGSDNGYSGDGIYHAEYNEMYNDDGPSHTMPGWHDGYLETYYNASGHYLAGTWTLDEEGFYHDENGRYVVGVDISHKDEMPYGTVVETGKGEGVVYDYGSGAEVHDFATNW